MSNLLRRVWVLDPETCNGIACQELLLRAEEQVVHIRYFEAYSYVGDEMLFFIDCMPPLNYRAEQHGSCIRVIKKNAGEPGEFLQSSVVGQVILALFSQENPEVCFKNINGNWFAKVNLSIASIITGTQGYLSISKNLIFAAALECGRDVVYSGKISGYSPLELLSWRCHEEEKKRGVEAGAVSNAVTAARMKILSKPNSHGFADLQESPLTWELVEAAFFENTPVLHCFREPDPARERTDRITLSALPRDSYLIEQFKCGEIIAGLRDCVYDGHSFVATGYL